MDKLIGRDKEYEELKRCLRFADHQAARAWQSLGGRVSETLRHIQVILRQAPQ